MCLIRKIKKKRCSVDVPAGKGERNVPEWVNFSQMCFHPGYFDKRKIDHINLIFYPLDKI